MELPSYTIAVARLFNAPAQAGGFEERYRAEFEAVASVLDADELEAAIGSTGFETCDLSALEETFLSIKAEFERPQMEAKKRELAELNDTLSAVDLDKLARVASLMAKPQSRQGFRRVV